TGTSSAGSGLSRRLRSSWDAPPSGGLGQIPIRTREPASCLALWSRFRWGLRPLSPRQTTGPRDPRTHAEDSVVRWFVGPGCGGERGRSPQQGDMAVQPSARTRAYHTVSSLVV